MAKKKKRKSHPRKFGPAIGQKERQKGQDTRNKTLTAKQKRFVAEYLKTGNASGAVRAAYDTKDKYAATMGYQLLNTPKIAAKIEEAMKAANLDEDFAVRALKGIIEAGSEALDEVKPGDALRGLEMFFKMKGYMGSQKQTLKLNFKEKANAMSTEDLKKELKKLDKQQQQLFAMMKGEAEEGEVLDGDAETIGDEV